jgi:predicted 3-demethylubiquinone-9 3-methyltransferase (glyoxalase superfamily)
MSKHRITPSLWFDRNAQEAVNFYTSIFKNSNIETTTYYGDAGPGPKGSVAAIYFHLDGNDFIAINGGPEFKFTEAVSFTVNCDGQKEVDEFWNKLLAGGGRESQCGWLKDKFGLSWQVVPTILPKLLQDKDPAKAQRVMEAMLQMKKLDVERLQRAHDEPAYAGTSTGRAF